MTPPRPRWHDIRSTFRDLAITTFDVDPAALAPHLPNDVTPEIVTLRDGRARALVSAVSFRATRFALRALPWPAASFTQVNYRAYLRRGDERSVWFFGTAVGFPWVLMPRYAWRLPWHRAALEVDAEWSGETCTRYRLRQDSPWGGAALDATGTGAPLTTIDGFATLEEARLVLTQPLVGHLTRRDGRRAVYRVWHEPMGVVALRAESARFDVFETLGLVPKGAPPHSVLVCRATEFLTGLPGLG